jgi:hypothetical protein
MKALVRLGHPPDGLQTRLVKLRGFEPSDLCCVIA